MDPHTLLIASVLAIQVATNKSSVQLITVPMSILFGHASPAVPIVINAIVRTLQSALHVKLTPLRLTISVTVVPINLQLVAKYALMEAVPCVNLDMLLI